MIVRLFFFLQLPSHFPPGIYNLTIEGNSTESYRFKNFTSNIYYIKHTQRVYVLTDKPIYRPSEKVMIRIVGVNPALLPLDKSIPVSVFIYVSNLNTT